MKILVINWQDWKHPLAGGAEVHLYEVFKRIKERGHNVTILSCDEYGLKKRESENGIEILRKGKREFFNFYIYAGIKEFLKKRRFDVIIDDINKIPFYTPLFTKKPVVAIVHHLFRKAIYKETSFLPAFYVYLTETLIPCVYRNTTFIAVSLSTKKDLINLGIPEENIHVVENGINLSLYKPLGLKREPMVLYVGRIKKYKSIEHLLYATKLLKNKGMKFKVVIVGDGDDLPRLKKITEKMKIKEMVEFKGFVKEKKLVEFYNRAYFVVQPSVKEGWGLSIVEAGACKTPVIAADSPGLKDSVIPNKTGFLYPYGNVEKLAEYMEILLKNKKLRNKFSSENYRWAKKFSWDRTSLKILKIIEDAVKKHNS